MPRSRKSKDPTELVLLLFKLLLGLTLIGGLALGGIGNIGHVLEGFTRLVALVLGVLILLGLLCLAVGWGMRYRAARANEERAVATAPIGGLPPLEPPLPVLSDRSSSVAQPEGWDGERVLRQLREIDWYQFEKFCAALLQAEGFAVERQGGAHPDGGVDLIIVRDHQKQLVQCKHWLRWKIKERVVRELLGSMTHLGIHKAAIYCLQGATPPAMDLARQHGIGIVDASDLAYRAVQRLSPTQLNAILLCREHHCPKCEAPMVLRTGNFKPFWGCSRYPVCRGTIQVTAMEEPNQSA